MEGTCRPRSSALIRKGIFQETTQLETHSTITARTGWEERCYVRFGKAQKKYGSDWIRTRVLPTRASLALRRSWDGFEITFLRSSGDGLFCPEPGARDGKLRYQCLTPARSLPLHSIYWAAMRVWKSF